MVTSSFNGDKAQSQAEAQAEAQAQPLLLSEASCQVSAIIDSSTDTMPSLGHGHGHHHLSSVVKTFGNIVISIVGAGVLGLPYTFKKTGWLQCTLVLAAVGLTSYYAMMLLIWSRKRLEKTTDHCIRTFSDLGFHLYGPLGRIAVDSLLVLSQGAFCIGYLIFIGENLASVISSGVSVGIDPQMELDSVSASRLLEFRNSQQQQVFEFSSSKESSWIADLLTSKAGYIWIIFPLQVVLASIKSLTMLAPFSIAADFANAIAMLVVMQQDVTTFVKNGIGSITAYNGFTTMPFAVGVAIYAFEGIGLVLPLESSMKDRHKFSGVLGLAMVCITLLYTSFGLLGYLAFGDATLDIITLNLGTTWKTIVVKIGLCMGLFFTFPVMMYPVHEVVERRLVRGRSNIAVRTVIVLGAAGVAVSVPQFSVFLSLIGNSVCCTLTFILPALFHVKAHGKDIPNIMLVLDYFIICFGVVYGIWGTISAVVDIFGA